MTSVALIQSPEQDRLFSIDGFGSVVPGGIFGGHAVTIVDASGGRFEARATGLGHRHYVVEDREGRVVGEYRRQLLRSGGRLHWRGDEFVLRRRGISKVAYELRRGGISVGKLTATGFPTQPVEVEVDTSNAFAAPLLFAAFLVRRYDRTAGVTGGGGGCGGGCGGGGGS